MINQNTSTCDRTAKATKPYRSISKKDFCHFCHSCQRGHKLTKTSHRQIYFFGFLFRVHFRDCSG